MSELVPLSSQSADLLAMAAQLDIKLDNDVSDIYSSSANKFTAYSKPAQIRTVYDAHNSDGVLKWTAPDFKGKATERQPEDLLVLVDDEPAELGAVIELRGSIVSYQQRDELRHYDGEKTNIMCSVIGYTNAQGEVVRDLPSTPYPGKYNLHEVNGKWGINPTSPKPLVEKLGLVGYRGERATLCDECIRCGMSTEIVKDPKTGKDKEISCESRGKLYMAVTEVAVMKKIKQEGGVKGKVKFVDTKMVYPVSQLLNLESEPIGDHFLIEVPMSRSSLQGKYVKNQNGKKDKEKTIEGYASFCRNLTFETKDKQDPLRYPQFHKIALTFRKHENVPTFQADFRSLGPISVEEFKLGTESWKASIPERTVETMEVLPIQKMQADGTINVAAAAVSSPQPKPKPQPAPAMKVITEVVQGDDLDLDDIPF